jgi:protoporphyrinogen oxidase
VKSFDPAPPGSVLEAANELAFRAMILIYLTLEQRQFSEYDAHYFPEERIPISRLSEPKNYSSANEPRDRTVLCAELPCQVDSPHWRMSDDQLGRLVSDALSDAGIPVKARVSAVVTRRLAHAYPLYTAGYEENFAKLENWIKQFPQLLTFGRQGLFAHDNTHHALYMAYSAVDCLDASGGFDHERWMRFRKEFEAHVVED